MSTGIEIKKKIAAKEEGVTITNDLSSLNFVGAGVTASIIGDEVTVTVPGSIGATTYYLNESVAQAPYKEFSSVPTSAAEQTVVNTVSAGSTITVESFQTPTGIPNTTNIPAGLWQFYLHFSGTFGDSWDIYVEVYKRDLGGIETLLLTTDLIPTTSLNAIPLMILTDGVFAAATLLTTDRIVVKVKVTNSGVANQTITFHTEGSTNYSVGTTTLNQVVGAGSVTSVTGTAPIASSGGTTPAISISQATTSTDGYLSSSDWNTFNGKQAPITLTTTGASGSATFITNTLNIPTYTLSGLGGVPTTRQITINGTAYDLSADRTWNVGTVTSVGLTTGTTGTDVNVSGSPVTGSGSITLNIPTASATNRGALSSADWSTFNGKQDALTLTTTGTSGPATLVGATLNIPQYAGGLVYFAEAQNTAAPNATVPVDSLTAVAGTVNADIAMVPKGSGAFTLTVPDNTATGGNKRGTNAVDLQRTRGAAAQVASGANSFAAGFGNVASGDTTIAIGRISTANANYSIAIGSGAVASGNQSVALGFSCNAIGNESIAMIGGTTSAQYTLAIGNTAAASNTNAVAIGQNTTASGLNSLAVNRFTTADAYCSNAFGNATHTFGVTARSVFGHFNTALGDCQKSIISLTARTATATPTTLTVGGSAASTTNQVILRNQSAYRFKGTIIGKQSGSSNVAAWDVDGLIVRTTSAATTSLVVGNVNLVSNTPAWGTPTLAADTTNGGLRVQVTGAVVDIQWTSIIETSEVIFDAI